MDILKKILLHLDRNVERYIIMVTYSLMAGIIFVEVIRRFLFKEQAAWSTTIPILLFLWLTWFGAAYNIKIRGHLALSELRSKLSYKLQFACFMLDAVAWIVFGLLVVYFSVGQVYLSYENFAIVAGTDNVMQWWFYSATPLAWTLIIIRVLQKMFEDIQLFKDKKPFIFHSTTESFNK